MSFTRHIVFVAPGLILCAFAFGMRQNKFQNPDYWYADEHRRERVYLDKTAANISLAVSLYMVGAHLLSAMRQAKEKA